MEKSKNNKFLLGIIVGILCGGMIFSGITYDLCDNLLKEEPPIQNEDNNSDEKDNNVTRIDRNKAQQIFGSIIKPESFTQTIMFQKLSSGQVLKIEDMSPEDIARLILITSSHLLKEVPICDTVYEQKFIELGIITDGQGQGTCLDSYVYDSNSIKDASIKLFGKSFDVLFDSNNVAKPQKYYYYAQGNISLIPMLPGAYGGTLSMSTYYIENQVLTIEFIDNLANQLYNINFNVDGNNFYLDSIGKL